MLGKRFLYLTVVAPAGKDKWGALMWHCECECGKKIVTRGTSLRSKNTTSCGTCSQLGTDYIGQKFGFLKIIGKTLRVSNNSRRNYYLICECECGEVKQIIQSSITKGITTSCGCKLGESIRRKVLGRNNHNFKHGKWQDRQYRNAMTRNYYARKRGNGGAHTWEDIEQLLIEQNYKCFYCKKALTNYHVDHKMPVSKGGRNDKGNLCCACPSCNLKKKDKTAEEFMSVIHS